MSNDRSDALRAALVDHVAHSYRTRRTQKLAALGGAVVIATGVTVAFSTMRTATPLDHGELHCRSGASVDSKDVGVAAGVIDPHQQPKYGDAVENCAALWRQRILTPGSDYPTALPQLTPGQIPPMIVCVDDSLTAVVVPATDPAVCGALGLAEATK